MKSKEPRSTFKSSWSKYNPVFVRDLQRQTTIISPSSKKIVQCNFPLLVQSIIETALFILFYLETITTRKTSDTTIIIELIKVYWRVETDYN